MNEADLVEGLVAFFARRGGQRNSGKFLWFLSLLGFFFLCSSSSLSLASGFGKGMVEVWSVEEEAVVWWFGLVGACCVLGVLV